MSESAFESLVDEALSSIPAELLDLVENCVLFIEDEPPEDDPDILGLYVGIPLTERTSDTVLVEPDQIYLYRVPILELCDTPDEVADEVAITVIHEIAHYFGIDDDRLHELGWS